MPAIQKLFLVHDRELALVLVGPSGLGAMVGFAGEPLE